MIWLHRLFGRSQSGPKRGNSAWLLDRESFQVALERERMRVDRNDSLFSLLVISARPEKNAEAVEHLAGVLRGRIRRTDTAGWFSGSHVGVILPDTPAHGAYKLAGDLSAPYKDSASTPIFDIYTHPADGQFPGSPQEQRDEQEVELVEARANREHDAADRRTRNGRKQDAARIVRVDHLAARVSPIVGQPIEGLLVQSQPAWKRMIDILGSVFGLILLAPLLALTAIWIKLNSSGPVIFAQRREGLGGRVFTMYKFRTMCADAESLKGGLRQYSEQDGPAFKLTNDPRITPLGHFLRKSCIDELPQLWNVLRGDMSLVGPRPLPVDESRQCLAWQRRRLAVRPGLTCIWQVEGGIQVTFEQWMRMDLKYAAARTPSGDARLLWKTFTKVLLRRASR